MGFLILLAGLLLARMTWRLWSPVSRPSRISGVYVSSSYRRKREAAVRDYQQRSSLAAQ
jgi:hypothetical protein